jgi:hypothetical protein
MTACEISGHDVAVYADQENNTVVYRHGQDRFSYVLDLGVGDEELMRAYERSLETWLEIIHKRDAALRP